MGIASQKQLAMTLRRLRVSVGMDEASRLATNSDQADKAGRVLSLQICRANRAPMELLQSVKAVANLGRVCKLESGQYTY